MDATFSNMSIEEKDGRLVSLRTRDLVQFVIFVILCGPLSAFGIGANIINMIVFFKQGFKDSMNISLFALAVADFVCLLASLWTSVTFNPLLMNAKLHFNIMEILYLTGGYFHECVNRITSSLIAYVTLERCLCIITPLKVKMILTPTRTTIINVSIFIFFIIIFSPFYFVNTLQWRFNSALNETRFELVFTEAREQVEPVIFLIHSVFMSAVVFISVIICTIILVVKLNKKTKWRQETVVQVETVSKSKTVSTKDRKVVKMVTFISTIFIICFAPATVIFFTMVIQPQFSFSGMYENIFFVAWSIAYLLETINSSVNVFVYYNMSSKYRETFLNIFTKALNKKK